MTPQPVKYPMRFDFSRNTPNLGSGRGLQTRDTLINQAAAAPVVTLFEFAKAILDFFKKT